MGRLSAAHPLAALLDAAPPMSTTRGAHTSSAMTCACSSAAGGRALVILGHGLAGRLEVVFEVEERHRGNGLATAALTEARRLAGPGAVLFAQTAPANVPSLRALLAAGFAPVGGRGAVLPLTLRRRRPARRAP